MDAFVMPIRAARPEKLDRQASVRKACYCGRY